MSLEKGVVWMAKVAYAQKRNSNRKSFDDEWREIEKLAYRFFEERGYQHGFDAEDWLRAETIVKSRRV